MPLFGFVPVTVTFVTVGVVAALITEKVNTVVDGPSPAEVFRKPARVTVMVSPLFVKSAGGFIVHVSLVFVVVVQVQVRPFWLPEDVPETLTVPTPVFIVSLNVKTTLAVMAILLAPLAGLEV